MQSPTEQKIFMLTSTYFSLVKVTALINVVNLQTKYETF